MKMITRVDTIKCPNCGHIQEVELEEPKAYPYWYSLVHDCEKCNYTIMESEWDKVKESKYPKGESNNN